MHINGYQLDLQFVRCMANFPGPGSESVMRFRSKELPSVMLVSSPTFDPYQDYNLPPVRTLQ